MRIKVQVLAGAQKVPIPSLLDGSHLAAGSREGEEAKNVGA